MKTFDVMEILLWRPSKIKKVPKGDNVLNHLLFVIKLYLNKA